MSSESQRILDKYNKHKASSFDVRNEQRRQMAEKARKEAEERRKKRQRDREARLNIKPNSQAELHKSIRENEQVPTKKRKEDREKEKERQYHTYAEDDPALKVFYNRKAVEEARELRQRKLEAAGGKQRPSWRYFSIPNNVVITPPRLSGPKSDPFIKKTELGLTDEGKNYLQLLDEKETDIQKAKDNLDRYRKIKEAGPSKAGGWLFSLQKKHRKGIRQKAWRRNEEQLAAAGPILDQKQMDLDNFKLDNKHIGDRIENKREIFAQAEKERIEKSSQRKALFESQLFHSLPKTQGGLESLITGKNRPTLRSVIFDPKTNKTTALYSDAGIVPREGGGYYLPAGSTFSASIASRSFDISRLNLDTNAKKVQANKDRKRGKSLDGFSDVVGSLEVKVVTKTNNHGSKPLKYRLGGESSWYSAKGVLKERPEKFIDNSFMSLDIINNQKKANQDLDNFGAYRRHISTTARVTKDKQKTRGRAKSKKRSPPPPPVFGGLF